MAEDNHGDGKITGRQSTSPAGNADDALRLEFLAEAVKPESGPPYGSGITRLSEQNGGNNSSSSALDKPGTPRTAAQIKEEEAKQFKKLFDDANYALDPVQKGWGPYQVLEQMVKENKLSLNEDQILAEARRIRDRDFSQIGRNYYLAGEQPKLWSDNEIEKKVSDTVNKVKGIDVSSHQDKIDWKQVKDAGYQFAFLKASEGVDWVDPTFAENRTGAKDAGVAVGYYHYFRPNDPVDAQVKNFVDTVGKAEPNSLRLVIDAEDDSMWKPYTVQQRVKMIDDWCQGVKKALGVTPQLSVYSSPSFVNQILGNGSQLGKYSLWIAHYNVAEPILPKPWSKWDFWQYKDDGNVPGIPAGGVDLDMYNGNILNKANLRSKH